MSDNKSESFGDLSRIFGIWNILRIASNIDEFKEWLKEGHNITVFKEFFEGYKFFLQCTFNVFIYALSSDSSLGLDEDFRFFRAQYVGIKLSKIPNSCEKVVMIKNIDQKSCLYTLLM